MNENSLSYWEIQHSYCSIYGLKRLIKLVSDTDRSVLHDWLSLTEVPTPPLITDGYGTKNPELVCGELMHFSVGGCCHKYLSLSLFPHLFHILFQFYAQLN